MDRGLWFFNDLILKIFLLFIFNFRFSIIVFKKLNGVFIMISNCCLFSCFRSCFGKPHEQRELEEPINGSKVIWYDPGKEERDRMVRDWMDTSLAESEGGHTEDVEILKKTIARIKSNLSFGLSSSEQADGRSPSPWERGETPMKHLSPELAEKIVNDEKLPRDEILKAELVARKSFQDRFIALQHRSRVDQEFESLIKQRPGMKDSFSSYQSQERDVGAPREKTLQGPRVKGSEKREELFEMEI